MPKGKSIPQFPEKIVFIREAFGDMILACKLCPVEVSGLPEICKEGVNYVIPELIIPEQICDFESTSLTDEAMRNAFLEAEARGKNISNYFCWWHSHCGGKAYFSGTDEAAIRGFSRYLLAANQFSERPKDIVGPWISIVMNRSGKVLTRCDFARPRKHMFIRSELEPGADGKEVMAYMNRNRERMREIIHSRVRVRLPDGTVLSMDELERLLAGGGIGPWETS